MGHLNVEVFLSQMEQDIFTVVESPLGYSNFLRKNGNQYVLQLVIANLL